MKATLVIIAAVMVATQVDARGTSLSGFYAKAYTVRDGRLKSDGFTIGGAHFAGVPFGVNRGQWIREQENLNHAPTSTGAPMAKGGSALDKLDRYFMTGGK
jgi:hypothetical protein